jgi:AraC family transcriptional regulator
MDRPLASLAFEDIVVELWPRSTYEAHGTESLGVIGFAFDTQEGTDAIASDRTRPFRRRANTVSWVPPGCSVFSVSREGGEYLTLRNVAAAMIAHPQASERHLNGIVAPAAVEAAHALRRMVLSSSTGEPLSAVDLLVATLLHSFDRGPVQPSLWLTDARLGAVDRLIEARMHERIEVRDLAFELGLSVGYLVLAFRQSLGTTPHRYLMDRRLARARKLLASNEPIAAVATACGFADQAHLTRSLSQACGVTPARFRRKLQTVERRV